MNIYKELRAAGVEWITNERWLPAPNAPGAYISTEGRAFRPAHTVMQDNGFGTVAPRTLPAGLIGMTTSGPPRLRVRVKCGAWTTIGLAHEVLSAFVRPRRPWREVAFHLDGNEYNCRLSNLMWSGDRTAQMVDRFLGGEADCLSAYDLEHAAIRLGVSHSVLYKALSEERRRLGIKATPGPKPVAAIAMQITRARMAQSEACATVTMHA